MFGPGLTGDALSHCLEGLMKNSLRSRSRTGQAHRPESYRPRVEPLEARLPLGDALCGPVVSAAWFGANLPAMPELADAAVTTPAAARRRTATDDFLVDAEFTTPTGSAAPTDLARPTAPTDG